MSTRRGFALGIAVLVLGCANEGTVYVGQPQVFSRERLVDERYREHAWLREQLDKTDEIESQIQGMRDLRDFAGIYNELRASFDPAQGALDALNDERSALEIQAKIWDARREAVEAERAYREALAGPAEEKTGDQPAGGTKTPGDSESPNEAQPGAGGKPSGDGAQAEGRRQATENAETKENGDEPSSGASNPQAPFGRAYNKLAGVPQGGPDKSSTDPGLLVEFHDKLAYRDAVNAEMKDARLDDAHDIFGTALYEILLDISLVPGDDDSRYAQVKLELTSPADDLPVGSDRANENNARCARHSSFFGIGCGREDPPDDNRESARDECDDKDTDDESCAALPCAKGRRAQICRWFNKWALSLQDDMIAESEAIRRRLWYDRANQRDRNLLNWFLDGQLSFLSRLTDQRLSAINRVLGPVDDTGERERDGRQGANGNSSTWRAGEGPETGQGAAREEEQNLELRAERLPELRSKMERLRLFYLLHQKEDPLQRLKGALEREESSKGTLEAIERDLRACDPATIGVNTREGANQEKSGRCNRLAIDAAAAWAVWSAYALELARIVDIYPPNLHLGEKGEISVSGIGGRPMVVSGAFTVEPLPSGEPKRLSAGVPGQTTTEGNGDADGNGSVSKKEKSDTNSSEAKGNREDTGPRGEGRPAGASDRLNLWPAETDVGVGEFVDRILQVEREPRALRVEPKELAQNVSEVRARESVANFVAAISAMVSGGAKIENELQYLRRTQERLHGITRRPLIFGFNQGGSQFGWVLGPKFSLGEGGCWFPDIFCTDSAVEWSHTPVRHTFSAAVVVPGWWSFVCLHGEATWIDGRGRAEGWAPVWKGDGRSACPADSIRVPLPMQTSPERSLTEALMLSAPRVVAGSPRMGPAVKYPTASDGAVLRAGEKSQTLLIRGSHLWRSPEVYVGSARADGIEVHSDMEGLLAEFKDLAHPAVENAGGAPVNADLRVVTAYGAHEVAGAVRILPPKAKKAAPARAQLLTTLVHPGSGTVAFAWPRPAQYGRLLLRLREKEGPAQQVEIDQHQWSADGKTVFFEYGFDPATTRTAVMSGELVLFPTPKGTGGGTAVSTGVEIVRFSRESDAAAQLNTADVTFPKAPEAPPADGIGLEIAEPGVFASAYPGLAEASHSGRLRLRLISATGRSRVLELQATEAGGTLYLTVPAASLAKRREDLLGDKNNPLKAGLVVPVGASGERAVPVVMPDGKPGTVTFKEGS